MRVYLTGTEEHPALLIDRQPGRSWDPSLLVVTPGDPPSTRWSLPQDAEELVTREALLEEVTEAMEEAKLTAAARKVVASVLESLAQDPSQQPSEQPEAAAG